MLTPQPTTPISLEVEISEETYDSLAIYIETIATRGDNIRDPISLQSSIIEQAIKAFLRVSSGDKHYAPE